MHYISFDVCGLTEYENQENCVTAYLDAKYTYKEQRPDDCCLWKKRINLSIIQNMLRDDIIFGSCTAKDFKEIKEKYCRK